jgi:hypothetical protein
MRYYVRDYEVRDYRVEADSVEEALAMVEQVYLGATRRVVAIAEGINDLAEKHYSLEGGEDELPEHYVVIEDPSTMERVLMTVDQANTLRRRQVHPEEEGDFN